MLTHQPCTHQANKGEFGTDLITTATMKLNQKMSNLKVKNKSLSHRLSKLENSMILDNLVIHGLPEPPNNQTSARLATQHQPSANLTHQDLTRIMGLCCTHMGLNANESDTSYTHRMSLGVNIKPRSLLIRFSSCQARNLVYSNRKSL